jgi:hypothetical protein
MLDEVDISWEVSGDFHANSLLANLWLVPDFHGVSPDELMHSETNNAVLMNEGYLEPR